MRDTELMAKWFEDVGARVREQLKNLDEDGLVWRSSARSRSASGRFPTTRRARGRSVARPGSLQGCFAHVGEIDALLAIRERSAQRTSA